MSALKNLWAKTPWGKNAKANSAGGEDEAGYGESHVDSDVDCGSVPVDLLPRAAPLVRPTSSHRRHPFPRSLSLQAMLTSVGSAPCASCAITSLDRRCSNCLVSYNDHLDRRLTKHGDGVIDAESDDRRPSNAPVPTIADILTPRPQDFSSRQDGFPAW